MQLNLKPDHKPRLKFNRLGTWYILALSAIAVISVLGQVLIQRHLADQVSDSQVVNLAGKQRMLSQKITKTVLKLRPDQSLAERNEILVELQDANHQWSVSQQGLQSGNDSLHLPGNNSAQVAALFNRIDQPFKSVHNHATEIIRQLGKDRLVALPLLQPAIDNILSNEKAFLAGMDLIVRQFAKEANEKIDSLRRMELFLLIVSLMVITAEVLFIFRPTAIQVTKTVKKLRTSEKNAKKLLNEIGALYASLERSYEQLSVINQPIENPRLYAKADIGGNITLIADAAEEVTGIAGARGYMRLCDLFPGMKDPDDWMDEIVDTVSEGNAWQGEVKFRDPAGAVCWVSLIVQPVNIEGTETELVMMGSNMTERKKAEQNMNKKNRAEIEKLVNQQKFRSVLILEGQEEERKRIAMDIHDGIGQMLTSLKYQIESIDSSEDHVQNKVFEVDRLIKNVIKEVRRVTFNLKPTVLGDYGLQSALKVFVQEIAKLTEIPMEYEADGEIDRLPQKIENNIFRIIQEAINNAIKYSEARIIKIHVRQIETDLVISVVDEGKGFDTRLVEARSVNIESGRGFFNMYERTEYVNGKLDIQSTPGKGTTVTLSVPVRKAEELKPESAEIPVSSEQ